MSKNDITGDNICSRALSRQGRDNWDNIFCEKKSAVDWMIHLYAEKDLIRSPDGWRCGDGVTLQTPISLKEFHKRFLHSTLQHLPFVI